MKKTIKLISMLLITILLSGCENNNELKSTKCTLSKNNSDALYSFKSEYVIYSNDGVVKKVEITETVTSTSGPILDYFESYLTNLYKTNDDAYGGYSNKIVKENDELISTATIDYESMDIIKYSNDNPSYKNISNNNNQITLEGIKSIYTSLGATCE